MEFSQRIYDTVTINDDGQLIITMFIKWVANSVLLNVYNFYINKKKRFYANSKQIFIL